MKQQHYSADFLAAIYLTVGHYQAILKDNPVPTGTHKIGRRLITSETSEGACVVRDEGEKKDGIIYGPPKQLELTVAALLWLRALERENTPLTKEEAAA